MNASHTIHQAGSGDLKQLAPLLNAYRMFYGQQSSQNACQRFLADRFAAEDSVIFLATCNHEAAGFTQLYPSYSTTALRRIWILNDLFVSPQFRRQGIASALMQSAETFAHSTGAARLMLVTGKDNQTAQALYNSRNWQPDQAFSTYHFNLSCHFTL